MHSPCHTTSYLSNSPLTDANDVQVERGGEKMKKKEGKQIYDYHLRYERE